MRRLAVLATLLALSSFALAGSALAQDDGGGAADSGAAATPDTPAPGIGPATPGAASVNEAMPAVPVCADGSTTCTVPVTPTVPASTEDPYTMHDSGPLLLALWN